MGEDWKNRRNLGRPLSDEISRARLIRVFAERWVVRLVVVEAPGGFGKSIAVAQAIRDNDEDPSGIDVYVRCRSTMLTVADVADAVLGELGVLPVDGADRSTQISAAVESRSPADVCICLDDVHVVAELDGMVDHLEALLDDLRDIMDEVEDDGEFDDARLAIDLDRWFSDHFRTHDAKLHRHQENH